MLSTAENLSDAAVSLRDRADRIAKAVEQSKVSLDAAALSCVGLMIAAGLYEIAAQLAEDKLD